MPSYDTTGKQIEPVVTQPTSASMGMGCGGNQDCNCCSTVICLGAAVGILVIIVKYTC